MSVREWLKTGLLVCLLGAIIGIVVMIRRGHPADVYTWQCDCAVPLSAAAAARQKTIQNAPNHRATQLLSYQPPGNGWNNQRIALENALVLARLLNRTLVVHPLSPHDLGSRLKAGRHPGYVSHNMLNDSDLLPLSQFMDLDLMNKLVPVIEVNTSHPKFIHGYSHLRWKNICHSTGFGYWVDRLPQTEEEMKLFTRQKFTPSGAWRRKCPNEQERLEHDSSPIVRFVSDLVNDPAEMLYFEQGTLFGIHIRFTTHEMALEAQTWVVRYVRYNEGVWGRVRKVAAEMGPSYNAVQVRRRGHLNRKLPHSYWLDKMEEKNFSKRVPVYVATDEPNLSWFKPFTTAGFTLYFAKDFTGLLNFTSVSTSLRNDLLGIHEQCLCEAALQFVPSPASTFDALILRHRGEVATRDGLMLDTLHTYWLGHQTVGASNLNQTHTHP